MVCDKCGRERGPHIAGCAEAVQQQDRRAFAANPRVDRCPLVSISRVSKVVGKESELSLRSLTLMVCS
jgi:hypothetical protein